MKEKTINFVHYAERTEVNGPKKECRNSGVPRELSNFPYGYY